MAIKTITDLDQASEPVLGSDYILVSRNGIDVNKTTTSKLPISTEVQTSLDSKPTVSRDSNGNIISFLNRDNSVASNIIKTYTFGSLPLPGDYIGTAFVTDVGKHGSVWRSDGSTWGLANGEVVLDQVSSAFGAVTGVTTEQTVYTLPIQGGLLGSNGALEIEARWTLTNNANSKIQYTRVGGSVSNGVGMSGSASFGTRSNIVNRNSQTSQFNNNGTASGLGGATSSWTITNVNTANAFNITVGVILGVSTDSAVLEFVRVKLVRT